MSQLQQSKLAEENAKLSQVLASVQVENTLLKQKIPK